MSFLSNLFEVLAEIDEKCRDNIENKSSINTLDERGNRVKVRIDKLRARLKEAENRKMESENGPNTELSQLPNLGGS